MKKTILITGATDGIGLETAKMLASQGHTLLIHGRNPKKLTSTQALLSEIGGSGVIDTFEADFSDLSNVASFADAVLAKYSRLDVLINNAGVYKTSSPRTDAGLDLRFVVNTLAPAVLTQKLLPIMPETGRVISLSSAAQSPVDPDALRGNKELGDMPAYAQSKLALTMWSNYMAETHTDGPLFVAVNPGSLLNTNMVKKGWGGSDNDVGIGADILVRAALSDEFEGHSGDYFDNDAGRFGPPHPDALDARRVQDVAALIREKVSNFE